MIRISQSTTVTDTSQVSSARRIATQSAGQVGLGEVGAGHAALVTTELATNLVKHAEGGAILFGTDDDPRALVIVSLDRGPGIANVNVAMQDGHSTAGSPGNGLGAIVRHSSFFDVYSHVAGGTAILCRIDGEPAPPRFVPRRFAVGGICMPKQGEEHAGDAWLAIANGEELTVEVADGLGHGVFAAEASTAALRVLAENASMTLERILDDTHAALRPTRGAAVGIARIHAAAGKVDFGGVGNIAGTIATPDASRRVVSLNGIVGHEMRRVQTFAYPWTEESALVLASDGVSATWSVAAYPGLLQHDPALIAAVLYRDHCRGTDDATIVVVKQT